MRYVLDTNILLMYLRNEESPVIQKLTNQYDPLGDDNMPIICVVSVGEIRALALKNDWGKRRVEDMEDFLKLFVIADINADDVLDMYAEIDAFSQNKLKNKRLIGIFARNMGKNDLWIAAITTITNAILITTDSDFEHLHKEYFEVLKIVW